MPTQLWTLIGVALGGLLAATSQLGAALLRRRWQKEDQSSHDHQTKTARLFEHRRTAYVDYIQRVQTAYLKYWNEVTTRTPFEVPTDADAIDDEIGHVHDAFVLVSIYGTTETSDAAAVVNTRLITFLFATGNNSREACDDLELAREVLLERVRLDLGVEGVTGLLRPGPLDRVEAPVGTDSL